LITGKRPVEPPEIEVDSGRDKDKHMATISLFFILTFIVVFGAIGVALVLRAFAPLLGAFRLEVLITWTMVAIEQLKSTVRLAVPLAGWRRTGLLFLLFLPGTIPVLLLVALWRVARRFEFGAS
jgi:hypothetical protein